MDTSRHHRDPDGLVPPLALVGDDAFETRLAAGFDHDDTRRRARASACS
jgi:hypothetical protein